MFRQHDRITRAPVRATLLPLSPGSANNLVLLREHLTQEITSIGADRRVDDAAHLSQLCWIDVDHHLVSLSSKAGRREAGHHTILPGSNREKIVAVLNGKVGPALRDGSGTADVKRVIVGNHVDGGPGHLNRIIHRAYLFPHL